jgi:hypothetical protein
MVIPWCFSIFFGLNVASGDGAINLDEFTKLVQSPKLKSLGLLSNEPISQGLVNEYIYIYIWVYLCIYFYVCMYFFVLLNCMYLFVLIYMFVFTYLLIYIYRLQYIYIY